MGVKLSAFAPAMLYSPEIFFSAYGNNFCYSLSKLHTGKLNETEKMIMKHRFI
jgi:hypothetical protein